MLLKSQEAPSVEEHRPSHGTPLGRVLGKSEGSELRPVLLSSTAGIPLRNDSKHDPAAQSEPKALNCSSTKSSEKMKSTKEMADP